MSILERSTEKIRAFKVKHGLSDKEHDLITAIHLMNEHQVDKDTALDQSSRSSNDNGIDGWFLNEDDYELHIYQSKYSESKSIILDGLDSLTKAGAWLDQAIIKGELNKAPQNHAIINLIKILSVKKDSLKRINFVLISPYKESDLIDIRGFEQGEAKFRNSEFFKNFNKNGVKINYEIRPYNFSSSVSTTVRKYPVKKIPQTTIKLEDGAQLDLSYVNLYSLIKLYEQRGDVLFHKNVRLSLYSFKDSKHRVVSPMKETLNEICNGNLDPTIFPFFHGGITISAIRTEDCDNDNEAVLESPFVLNGCQTITIAHHYFKEIEKEHEKVERFKKINLIAKIVSGAESKIVREITICNNRQNPIEDWQLFSNDPIHCNIEDSLKDLGVFYERQKGKFQSIVKKTEEYAQYNNTNATFVSLELLGQIISVCKRDHQFSAKPSLIFISPDHHARIFDENIHKYPEDIIYCFNLFKAVKRATENAIQEIYSDQEIINIFKKPIVRSHIWWVLLLFHYQRKPVFEKAASQLYRTIPNEFVIEIQKFAEREIIRKVKNFYEQNCGLKGEVSVKKLTPFFEKELAEGNRIDYKKGSLPFSNTSKLKITD